MEHDDTKTNPQVKRLQKLVEQSGQKWRHAFKDIESSRNYAMGMRKGKKTKQEYSKSDVVQSNQIFATLQAMLPLTYAQNPEIGVKPEAFVDVEDPMLPQTRQFTRTLEIVLNKAMADAGLKKSMLSLIRSIQVSRVGWLKMSYQRDYVSDPIILNRLEDAQDQMAALNANMNSLMDESGYSAEDLEIKEKELEQTISSLEGQVNILRAEGLVIDNILVEDIRMDPDVETLDQYQRAKWIAQRTWMDKESVQEQFGLKKKDVEKFTAYQRSGSGRPTPDSPRSYTTDTETDTLISVWELWDKGTGTVYWWAEGCNDWLREPWQPERVGQRFYPFFCLGFNYVDSREWPLSDVEMLMKLQDEYDLSRTQEAKHRELTKPMFVADRARVSRQDVTSFSVAEIGEILLIDAGGQPVNQVFTPAQHPPMIPQVYDITRVRGDMEWVSGLGDAQRGSVGRAKTATEASIQQEGLSTRVEARKDQLEDMISEMAVYGAEILLQEMPQELVQRYAGMTAFWPADQMTKDQIFSLTEIKIRAGSSGKPNKEQDMQKWGMIMPEVKEVLERALMMQQEMMIPVELNPWVKLLSETMRKADEAFDVMEMFPQELLQFLNQIGQQRIQLQQMELQNAQLQMQMQTMQMQMQAQQVMMGEQNLEANDQMLAEEEQAMAEQPVQ